jgi:hypothetical protein
MLKLSEAFTVKWLYKVLFGVACMIKHDWFVYAKVLLRRGGCPYLPEQAPLQRTCPPALWGWKEVSANIILGFAEIQWDSEKLLDARYSILKFKNEAKIILTSF